MIKIGIVTITMLSISQSANATLYNRFEFTDVFGTEGTGGIITGTIGFDSLDSNHSGKNTISATSFVIDSIPSYFEDLWTEDLAFAVGKNIVGTSNDADPSFTRTYDFFTTSYSPSNIFTVIDGLIADFKFEERFYLGTPDPLNPTLNEKYEWVTLGGAANEDSVEDLETYPDGYPGNWLEITYPNRYAWNEDSITFSAVSESPTAVPESSPILGLLAIGGIWGISRFKKRINDKS